MQGLSAAAFSESTAPIVLPDWLPLPAKSQKKQAIATMDGYVSGLVRGALARPAGDADLISSLVEHHDGDFTAIRDDAMSLLIAGHETSGALLTWTIACLARHPEWLSRAQSEIDQVVPGTVSFADLRNLPTIKAIIDEPLRLYPPAYSLFLREATEIVELPSVTIRPGDLVQIVPFTTQRDARFFADPHSFDPARFLREPSWPAYALLPFGAGPRSCIGQSFGLMEAALALITLLKGLTPLPLHEMPRPQARFSLRPGEGLPMSWWVRGKV